MEKTLEKPSLELVKKYSYRTAYYSDYPILGLWDKKFGDEEYRRAIRELAEQKYDKPFLLYIHFPYCPKQCFYCMCFSEISQSHDKTKQFLENNRREIEMFKDICDQNSWKPNITRIHFGGGSPSFMDKEEFKAIIEQLKILVDPKEVEEFAIEIDPRTVTQEMMQFYSEMGINRISFGIQDFNPDVQRAVNRIQPIEMIERLMAPEIRKLFTGVNFDMIFGLPRQTRKSFRESMEEVIKLSPDRLGVCILGWRPDVFIHQRAIKEEELPTIEAAALMNFDAIQKLLDNGYERIGIDFHAKSTDDLAMALREHTLRRSAMGYSRGEIIDCLGFGPSAMSRMGDYYFQRGYDLPKHDLDLEKGKFPVIRGWKLTKDEQMRRDIMESIVCYSKVDFGEIEQKYNIDFKSYFKQDLELLNELIKDGIVKINDNSLDVTEMGRFFHRHVCVAFDALLRKGKEYKHARDDA